MSLPVRITTGAALDLEEAKDWYLEEAPGLEQDFERETARTLQLISDRPQMYPDLSGLARRAVLRRFPYSVYYRVLPEWVEVIAVLHQARHPRTWMQRSRS